MRRVDRPDFVVREVFARCISRIQDAALKTRLENIAEYVVTQSDLYAERAAAAELHLIPTADNVNGTVTTEEMTGVYQQRLAGKKGPGRHIYDAIRLLPKNGICPFCDHRPVTTLDHLLPKTFFPTLSVTPDNLIGACGDCNKLKLSDVPILATEVVIHPYFDNVEEERWLDANVVEGAVPAVVYYTRRVPTWSDTLNERILTHFRTFDLASLYSAQAAREIAGQALLLDRIFGSGGAHAVRDQLRGQAETREAVHLNSWQAVLYRVLANSEWFCDGGFRMT